MDITAEILQDHNEQRRLFAIIEQIEPGDTKTLSAVWLRLRNLLEVHAEAEERHFYPDLLKIGTGANDADSAEEETEDAIRDHNKIRDADAEVDRLEVGSPEWFDAVARSNKENSDHMAEEERQCLADFRHHSSLEKSHELAKRFLAFKYEHLNGIEAKNKDVDEYIAEHTD